MFLLGKLLDVLLHPLAWAALLLLAGLLVRQAASRQASRWAPRLQWLALAVLLLAGWLYPAHAVLKALEDRYPPVPPQAPLAGYAGVVVLGGAVDSSEAYEVPGRIGLNAHAERMVVAAQLARQHPHLKVIFTGGEGELVKKRFTEADRAQRVFEALGLPPGRVLYEADSRTTHENAVFTARMPGVDARQPWLLLTTAAHMPRSMAVYRKAGWNVTAYPVDYQTKPELDPWAFSYRNSGYAWHYALHETIGYAAYWLTGKI
jgi:uncharacterized SAM-binding protein YcdF (DUF218 family)